MGVWWTLLLPFVAVSTTAGLVLLVHAVSVLGFFEGIWPFAPSKRDTVCSSCDELQKARRTAVEGNCDKKLTIDREADGLHPPGFCRSLKWYDVSCTVLAKADRKVILQGAHCNARAKQVVGLLGELGEVNDSVMIVNSIASSEVHIINISSTLHFLWLEAAMRSQLLLMLHKPC